MHRSKAFAFSLLGLLLLPTCKTRSGGGELKEAWFSLMDSKWKPVQEVSDRNEYIRRLESLPMKGEIKPIPWTNFEKSDRSPDMNYAATSILFAEPTDLKADKSTPAYSSAAIKALLIKHVSQHSKSDEGVETRSLGGICRLDSDTYRRALEPRASSLDSIRVFDQNQCFTVNAGAFHLALANFIGLRNLALILDPELDQEFTHYPIVSFVSEPLGVAAPMADNHSQLQIKSTVRYLVPTGELKTTIFRYTLEMDETGDILNGEWLGKTIPQLVWIQNRPPFAETDAALENLYTRSVSLPTRLATQDFSSLDLEDPKVPVKDQDPLLVNHKYRIELSGDLPIGADGLQTFLKAAFRPLGNISIYRNTFADEDRVMSIEIQIHSPLAIEAMKQAVRDHSNGRSEIERILR